MVDTGNSLHKARRCASLEDAVELLTLLERDLPKQVMCIICSKLHRRHMRDEAGTLIKDTYRTGRACAQANKELSISAYPHMLHVEREAVDLALRAALQGPQCGLDITAFTQTRHWNAYSVCKNAVKLDMEALVIRNHIFIMTTQTVEVDLRRSLDAQVKQSTIRSCGHTPKADIESATDVLTLLSLNVNDLGAEASYKCRYCPTDAIMEASRLPDEVFASLSLKTYRDLGSRGAHTNREWNHHCESEYTKKEFQRDGGEYVFGLEDLCGVYEDAKALSARNSKHTASSK